MQLLEGRTLAEGNPARKRLPALEVVQYGCQALKAMRATHGKGLVHRDIKPENLFLHRVENVGIEVKLWISVWHSSPDVDSDTGRFRPVLATETGSQVGSPRFGSPEALRGNKVDARSDVFPWAL